MAAEATKNLRINLLCGINKTNNVINLYSCDCSKLRAIMQALTAIEVFYDDKTVINGQEITVPCEEAIKRTRENLVKKNLNGL